MAPRRSGISAAISKLRPHLPFIRVVGVLEGGSGNVATGWVSDPRLPDGPATVEFTVEGEIIHTAEATLFRQDVKDAGYGSGLAGFRARLPVHASEEGVVVHARLAGTSWSLRNSPRRMGRRPRPNLVAPGPAPTTSVPNMSDWRLPNPPLTAVAFYLPQFHPIPENDRWWGKGFTEWSNVTRGAPQFPGHYQPHRPGELGYYDLRVPDIRRRQVELASAFGLGGFCFYFYWFNGKTLLEDPVRAFADDATISFPFCLCWANENWTRRWDGMEDESLIQQEYGAEDDIDFISHIARYLRNPHYLRYDSKPILLVYRAELLPEPAKTAERWRAWCRQAGIGEIYLICTQSFLKADPRTFGFDAAVEFPPNNSGPQPLDATALNCTPDFEGHLFEYDELAVRSQRLTQEEYPLFRGVFPSWDNTARRRNAGTVFVNSRPETYLRYFENVARDTIANEPSHKHRLMFINAWNEWAEGAHLEPDERHGYAYLEATRMAMIRAAAADAGVSAWRFGRSARRPRLAVIVHAFYPEVVDELLPMFRAYDPKVEFFFTTSAEQLASLKARLVDLEHKHKILTVPNRGRDIAPFLHALRRVRERKFQYVLKLHTKRSVHRDDGDAWRSELYETLASPEQVAAILAELDERPDVGIAGPANHIVHMSTYWGLNRDNALNLCRRLGVATAAVDKAAFVSGTMFFARLEALEPMLGLSLTLDDFEEEQGQLDGTLAHALERAFTFAATAASLRIQGIRLKGDEKGVLTDKTEEEYKYADWTDS